MNLTKETTTSEEHLDYARTFYTWLHGGSDCGNHPKVESYAKAGTNWHRLDCPHCSFAIYWPCLAGMSLYPYLTPPKAYIK